ncbi:PREDICTED: uncharacterized protein LOC109474756 [Branchiostoma belcheri]|uniref:Uncharacterized protein LOC109474756 n=1 Tax=Branchiostoma belcheri TaxID=7741 RepID=A0A6P4ZM13_BRABE|nr:PREDICTED: uncharacterized protein LOC109474756 [Branchiostoma belcheri]
MTTRTWEHLFTCKWTVEGQLDITGFPEDMPMSLQFYLTSIRPEKWPRALKLIQQGEGHCFANEIGILFPFDYESSSSEEDQPSRGPLPEDEVEFFAGYFPKDRVKKNVFLQIVEKCLDERKKSFCPLDRENEFLDYVRRETTPKRAMYQDLPEPGSTGIERTTSVDSLAFPTTSKQTGIVHPFLDTLNLATDIPEEDTNFTNWVTNHDTKQLALSYRMETGRLKSLELKHEITKRQVESQRHIVQHLQKEVTRLTKEQETVQKVLLEDKEKNKELTEANESMEAIINDLLAQKTKLTNKLAIVGHEEHVPHKKALDESVPEETVPSTHCQMESEMSHTAMDLHQLTTSRSTADTHKDIADVKEKGDGDPAVHDGKRSASTQDQSRTTSVPADRNMTSLPEDLRVVAMRLTTAAGQERGALKGGTAHKEGEALISLADRHLEKGKVSKDSTEFDKAAGLYAAALLQCTDPDIGETTEHPIGFTEKADYDSTAEGNVLRVAKICFKVDRGRSVWGGYAVEEEYRKTLVTAITKGDTLLEQEVLKSLGDRHLEKGKAMLDVSQLSKAAALYNKALTRCEGSDGKQTLLHRIRYTEKLEEYIKQKKRRSAMKRKEFITRQVEINERLRRNRLQEHLRQLQKPAFDLAEEYFSDTDPTVKQYQRDEKPVRTLADVNKERIKQAGDGRNTEAFHMTRQYSDHFKKGESSLARADLDSAEQHFAAVLKTVHVRDPTAQQYQREVEPLCKLGDVYSKRGQQTGEGGDFVKAAALYNAAIARSEDHVLSGNIGAGIREVEKSFIKCVLGVGLGFNVNQDNTERHKKQLKEMRDQIKLEMETIDQQLDPYVHDEDDPCVREIEAKRAQAVRLLVEKITQQRKEFISLLVEECFGLMGPPPCKYALIGLATELVTPYSDLEFAILVEKESEECVAYFRNLTHYLHLKVVNLGETILPALGIRSLNDFSSQDPLDDWYYDSITPHGFAFDGSMPMASKTPLGRHGSKTKPPNELICTPENMCSKLQDDITLHLKKGYHLATILRNPCLIAGNQSLIDTYMGTTAKILQADGSKMAQQLTQEALRETSESYNDTSTITARLIDVKKELYRFPTVAIDCLALSSGIVPTTVWETIEEMEKQLVISSNNAHHLKVLTSISAELRLRTHLANGGQKENLSYLVSIESLQMIPVHDEVPSNALNTVFHLPNEKQLFRYYQTAVPLKSFLYQRSGERPVLTACVDHDLYDNSPRVQGIIYTELCKYSLAISSYAEALKKVETSTNEKMTLLRNLGDACLSVGDYPKAISYNEHALEMYRSIHGESTAHLDIAMSLNELGKAWSNLGDQRKAIRYFEQALQMKMSIYGQTKAHPDIAMSLNNLGHAWYNLGDIRKAISYNEQAIQMYKVIYGTKHPEIAKLLNQLGQALDRLGDYQRAISYHNEALQMYMSIYDLNTAHPHIAAVLVCMGRVCLHLGDYRKAISYYQQSLQMYKSIYGPNVAHPDIARLLHNLGQAWGYLDHHTKAINYLEQALQMYRSIYGQTKAHPDIATSLENLGGAWYDLGDYRKAISYIEQSLVMRRIIYGVNKAHPDIAMSLNNLGSTWLSLGDYRKAISCYEQALHMHMVIFGHDAEHPHITISLHNMGMAWLRLGDYNKAITYFEQTLQMLKSIYGQTTAHPDISRLLNNLGKAWFHLGDHRKSLSYHEEALKLYWSTYV